MAAVSRGIPGAAPGIGQAKIGELSNLAILAIKPRAAYVFGICLEITYA
jgi:hypothetical protein